MSKLKELIGRDLSDLTSNQAFALIMTPLIILAFTVGGVPLVKELIGFGEQAFTEDEIYIIAQNATMDYIDQGLGGSPYQTEKTGQYILNTVGANTYALLGDDGKLHGFYDASEDSMKTWVRGNMTGEHAYLRNITQSEGYIIEADGLLNNYTCGEYVFGQAGEALCFGDLVYLESDGDYMKCDANNTANMYCVAIAAEKLSNSEWGFFMTIGYIRCDSWGALTVGSETPIMVSWLPGGITQTLLDSSGDQVQRVGYALASKVMKFDPDSTVVEVQ
jgi:hypothetical protein